MVIKISIHDNVYSRDIIERIGKEKRNRNKDNNINIIKRSIL